MTDSSTAQATGLTEAQAAEAFERMLGEDADSGAGEALEEETPQSEADDEPEASDEEEDGADAEDESEDGAEDEEGDEEQPQTYRVKVDGEEVEVTLDEALRGYQREQDYTRKTQALADERKALEPEKAALQAERARTSELLKQLEQALEEPATPAEQLEWLKANDPAQYAVAVAENLQRQEQKRAAQAERERLERANAEEQAKTQRDALKAEEGKLLAARPAWKDPAEFQKAREQIIAYATERGISPEEVDSVGDHRLILALHEAALYRALQARKPAPKPKTSQVKPAKPGVATGQQPKKVTEITRARQRLAKTNSVHDAAAVFERMLPD